MLCPGRQTRPRRAQGRLITLQIGRLRGAGWRHRRYNGGPGLMSSPLDRGQLQEAPHPSFWPLFWPQFTAGRQFVLRAAGDAHGQVAARCSPDLSYRPGIIRRQDTTVTTSDGPMLATLWPSCGSSPHITGIMPSQGAPQNTRALISLCFPASSPTK